jgi:archaellum component FlaF (FlaF/FlaG flagellin family)
MIGTSASTALASATAALAFTVKPDAAPAEVHRVIKETGYYHYQYEVKSFRAPSLSAGRVVFAFGGTDSVPPVVSGTGLRDKQLIPVKGVVVQPTVTDDLAVDHYEVVIGGKVISEQTVAQQKVLPHRSSVEYDLPAGLNGPVAVTLRAYDFGGNLDEATTEIIADTTRPQGTIVSPAAGAIVHGDRVDVVVSSPDPDVVTVREYLQTEEPAFVREPGTDLWKGSVELNPAGAFTIDLRDEAGNLTLLNHEVRNDYEPPAGGTITPAYGTRVRGTFTSTLSGVTDLGGVAKAELWANGKYVGQDTTAPYALAVKTGTSNGNVMLTWRVTDKFGQWRNVPNRLVIADNKAPSVSITKAPRNKARVKGTVKVYAKASDASGISKVELIVNGKVVSRDTRAGYVLSVNTKKQKKTMTVRVRAYDKLGNVTYSTTRVWRRA